MVAVGMRWGFICITACLMACQSVAKPTATEAVLIDPDGSSRAELATTVATMLKVPSITLADDALTADSLMIIEKVRPRDSGGISLSGREFDTPEQFRLLKIDNTCVLVQVRTSARRVLRQSQCAPARHPK